MRPAACQSVAQNFPPLQAELDIIWERAFEFQIWTVNNMKHATITLGNVIYRAYLLTEPTPYFKIYIFSNFPHYFFINLSSIIVIYLGCNSVQIILSDMNGLYLKSVPGQVFQKAETVYLGVMFCFNVELQPVWSYFNALSSLPPRMARTAHLLIWQMKVIGCNEFIFKRF